MPEQWMHDVTGDEATPRPGFEDRLAKELHREWHGDSRRRWTTLVGSAAAVAAVVAAVVVASDGGGHGTVTPATSSDVTVDTAPETTTDDSSLVTDPPMSVKTVTVAGDTAMLGATVVWSSVSLGVPDVAPPGANPGGETSWTAAVLPSGRVFVARYSLDTPQSVSEVDPADGSLSPIGLDITGVLRAGPDERLYNVDSLVGRMVVFAEVGGSWITATSSQLQNGAAGDCRVVISPDEVRCGALAVPVDPMIGPSVEISQNLDVIVRTTSADRFDQTYRWKMQLDLRDGASLGDCTDDACLTNRPFGDDGVLWTPVLGGTPRTSGDSPAGTSNVQLLALMRPIGEPVVVWAQLSGQPAGVVGVVGNDVYLLALTGAGATVEKITMPVPVVDPALPDGIARPVKEYLVALADGDYLAAAKLLGEGGLEWTARADLRPLYRPQFGLQPDDGSQEGLAAALERWCEQAYCDGLADLTVIDDRWVTAGPGNGHDGLFSVAVFEGQAGVQGLPLPIARHPDGVPADNDTAVCPTSGVERTAWSDIDGDGWLELLVAQVVTPPQDESGVQGYRIVACGTPTLMDPFEISGDSIRIYPVNPDQMGPDELLIGFAEGYDNGLIYSFEGGALQPRQRDDGSPAVFGFRPYFPAALTGVSLGCASIGAAPMSLVAYDFTVDEKGVHYTVSDPFAADGDLLVDQTVAPDTEEAVQIQTGYCNGLPVQAY